MQMQTAMASGYTEEKEEEEASCDKRAKLGLPVEYLTWNLRKG